MKSARKLIIPALVGLGISSTAAQAKIMSADYSGVVTSGLDSDNLFGRQGEDLTGELVSALILYDTGVPGTRTIDAKVGSDEIAGGDRFFTAPVILSAAFTIGSKTFQFNPTYYGDVYTSGGFTDAYGYDTNGAGFQTYLIPDRIGPANLEMPFLSSGRGDPGGAATQYSFLSNGSELLDFNANRLVVSPAPEPAEWLLLILGVALVGLTLRARQLTDPVDGPATA